MHKQSFNIDAVLQAGELADEYQYQQAIMAHRSLRQLARSDDKLKAKKEQLRDLILDYENQVWDKEAEHAVGKIDHSDWAEDFEAKEAEFVQVRKHLILDKLKQFGLTQQQLGMILGHDSKSYMSELMNGIRPFTLTDLVLIHRLLKIELEALIPPFIDPQHLDQVQAAMKKLPNHTVQLEDDFSLKPA